MEFLPDGRMLVTEKGGKLRIVAKDGSAGPAIPGVPKVDARGQGGLLDVALSPSFPADRRIYLSYAEPREKGNGTSVLRAKLIEENGAARLDEVKVIFRQTPSYDGDKHFGSRLVFAPDGKLFVTVGERSDKGPRVQAQDLTSGLGKVFRIDTDGNAAKDNPSPAARRPSPRSGPTATATSSPPPSTRRGASGPSSTARAAATNSTGRDRASITAGRR